MAGPEAEPSYVDYEAFLDPDFSPVSFANTLITTTNNPSDVPLDLATPLSRVLFDVQEVDTHLHNLTTKAALPLLELTEQRTTSAQKIVDTVEPQVRALTEGYARLEHDVIQKYHHADALRVAAENTIETLRLARDLQRCLMMGRQLADQMALLGGRSASLTGAATQSSPDDYKALVGAAFILADLQRLLSGADEGQGLQDVRSVKTLKADLVDPAEVTVKSRSQQIINRLASDRSMSGSASTARNDLTRAKVTPAVSSLYLLSPVPQSVVEAHKFEPVLMLQTLRGAVQTAITSAVTVFTRALSLPSQLEHALSDIASYCQAVVMLESILQTVKLPKHPHLSYTSGPAPSPLELLTQSLDTTSVVTHFWRSLASALNQHVQEAVSRGGTAARTLRSSPNRLRDQIRECVLQGSRGPEQQRGQSAHDWEREAMVMSNAITGPLMR
ncbi:hypothetical protein KEM52_004885 [Ascosphaera acerosa]|nr:hypothetical protein KEM52_004885 [Ascosphaera acerosa]